MLEPGASSWLKFVRSLGCDGSFPVGDNDHVLAPGPLPTGGVEIGAVVVVAPPEGGAVCAPATAAAQATVATAIRTTGTYRTKRCMRRSICCV